MYLNSLWYLLDCLKEIDAQESHSLAIYKDGKHGTLYYPSSTKFPYEPQGRFLRNGRLVQRLRKKAASLAKYVHIYVHIAVCFFVTWNRNQ